ncbi:unnamed protein product [Brassicogethes aeneus]|uniref:Signal transducing adapter molecule 1 n=1 Tax=Brassicogethes aeneus TaxID=1431903 RepID=A0A9P0B848_BRAAE|nr:unnamed protein product [Brassicogethes aeneus]
MSKSKSIFGSNDIANEVENATSEKNVEEDWGVIISICDKAGKTSEDAKIYLRCILKRLGNTDPHIGVKAVTLLDACIKNSGKTFHIEVASREFEQEFVRIVSKGNTPVARKLKESLKKWAENEFKSDPQLSLIPSLYSKLRSSGHDFSSSEPPKRQTAMSKDPNVVESQEEEEQILKAIELSLKETSGSPRANSASSSLYPSVNVAAAPAASATSAPAAKELRKVRALYDFEAAEDNELTFSIGEIICVIDDADANWWKGSNQRGEGLFPANFVTADLSVEPEQFLIDKAKKNVQFKDEARADVKEPEVTEINEEKIDRLLHLLHEADPTNPEHDTEEMLKLEGEVNGMGPLIDTELERVDRKHAQLTQLSADLVEALNLYHTLMREPQFTPVNKSMPYGYQPPHSMPYSGFPPNMHPPPPMGVPHGGPPSMGHPQNMPPPHQQQPHEPGRGVPFMPPQGQMAPPPPHFHPGMMPPPGGMPPMQMPPQGQDDRRFHTLPSYGSHPNVGPPPTFPQSASQNSMTSGGPQQTMPYVSSSTHIMH